MLLLLLGILIGWMTLPLVVTILLTLPWIVDRWRHPRADPFWKPGKK